MTYEISSTDNATAATQSPLFLPVVNNATASSTNETYFSDFDVFSPLATSEVYILGTNELGVYAYSHKIAVHLTFPCWLDHFWINETMPESNLD